MFLRLHQSLFDWKLPLKHSARQLPWQRHPQRELRLCDCVTERSEGKITPSSSQRHSPLPSLSNTYSPSGTKKTSAIPSILWSLLLQIKTWRPLLMHAKRKSNSAFDCTLPVARLQQITEKERAERERDLIWNVCTILRLTCKA